MGDDSGFTRWQISPNMSKEVSVSAFGRSWLHEERESGNGFSKMFFRLPLAAMRERERGAMEGVFRKSEKGRELRIGGGY